MKRRKEEENQADDTSVLTETKVDMNHFLAQRMPHRVFSELRRGDFEIFQIKPVSETELYNIYLDFERGKWKILEPDFEGIRYLTLFDGRIVYGLQIRTTFYYPDRLEADVTYLLTAFKNEFHAWFLRDYTPIPLRKMNPDVYHQLEASCGPLEVGVMSNLGDFEVWVCETHQKFYFLKFYLKKVEWYRNPDQPAPFEVANLDAMRARRKEFEARLEEIKAKADPRTLKLIAWYEHKPWIDRSEEGEDQGEGEIGSSETKHIPEGGVQHKKG
jgi:hypothetical protein